MKLLVQFLIVLGIAAVAVAILAPREFLDKAKKNALQGWERTTSTSKGRRSEYPLAVERLAFESRKPVEVALAQFRNAMATAPRFRLQARVVSQLPEGHLFVTGTLFDKGQAIAINQTYALFGHPYADKLKTHDPVDCLVCTAGPSNFTFGGKEPIAVEELVYTTEDPAAAAAPKAGDWLRDPSYRGNLDRRQKEPPRTAPAAR